MLHSLLQMPRQFQLSDDQIDKLNIEFVDHDKACRYAGNRGGAIGGRFTYEFTPTTLGVVVRFSCVCGKKIDLTDYENF